MTEPRTSRDMSEWLKVMLREIGRKSDEKAVAEAERSRRADEPAGSGKVAPKRER
jgi:hypothetical protein